MLFSKVLFATDFSGISENALNYVIRLREAGCEDVVLVHVIDEHEAGTIIERVAGIGGEPGHYEGEILKRMQQMAQSRLDIIETRLAEAGLKVSTHLITGVPYPEIVRLADAEEVDLILVGSHGRSDISQMFLGSVSENVIRHSSRPVLVISR